MLLCSTQLRPPLSLGPDRIVRLASEAGFEGVSADAGLTLPLLRQLAPEGLRNGLPVRLCRCPLPAEELAKGRRLPHLAAWTDPEERAAAVKLGRATLAAAGELSLDTALVDLGPVALHQAEARLQYFFSRREMGEDEPGRRLVRRVLEERRAIGGRLFDACRAALEPLLETASQRGLVLALPIAASPWQLPSPREAQLLLQEFAGAPLSLSFSSARRAVLQSLGLGGPPERWPELMRASRVLEAGDWVGLDSELLLGMGELELAVPEEMPRELHVLVGGPLESTFKEVLRARRRAEEALAARPEPPGESSGSAAAT